MNLNYIKTSKSFVKLAKIIINMLRIRLWRANLTNIEHRFVLLFKIYNFCQYITQFLMLIWNIKQRSYNSTTKTITIETQRNDSFKDNY